MNMTELPWISRVGPAWLPGEAARGASLHSIALTRPRDYASLVALALMAKDKQKEHKNNK